MQETKRYTDQVYFDDHRLEIENRMRNLFWTVCGDYLAEVHPDMELFQENPDAAVYETVRYGAFSKYFLADEVALYLWKKAQKGGDRDILITLFHVCMDKAVYEKLVQERKGIRDMRIAARIDLEKEKRLLFAKLTESRTKDDLDHVLNDFDRVQDTSAFIQKMDQVYNLFFDPGYEMNHGSLETVLNLPVLAVFDDASREALSDEQMEEIIKKYVDNLKKEMRRIRQKKQKTEYIPGRLQVEEVSEEEKTDPEAVQKVKDYVMLNYGKSCLNSLEQAALQHKCCRGMHAGCSLHITDGILHDPVIKNNQYRFSQLQFEKNRMHYYNNHWIVKRNITDLADILQKALVRKSDADTGRSISGQIVPGRLWKVGRTDDEKLFDRKNPLGSQEYVIDILLDSSGSQAKRQPQVAAQGYIISEALSRGGIPHKVMSFCSFWDYTILRRFRDYDDDKDRNMRIMEFRATGNNRDGLAISAVGNTLIERPEANRILIVLSDGKPCDITAKRPGTRAIKPYQGEEAVRDTAFAVRNLRNKGIIVLGIFSGNEEDVGSEKKIYGKDFAYIRELRSFSNVVGRYLKRQIESEE